MDTLALFMYFNPRNDMKYELLLPIRISQKYTERDMRMIVEKYQLKRIENCFLTGIVILGK